MMTKSIGHKEKYANKSKSSHSHSNDGTCARTRPFSYDDIMLRRKNKKQSGSIEDQRGGLEAVSGKGVEGVSGRVESDRRRHSDIVRGSEQHVSKESLRVSSRRKDDKTKIRESRATEGEDKESNYARIQSKVIGGGAKDGRNERGIHEKRKNDDRSRDDSENEHGKRHVKDFAVKDRDRTAERNRGKEQLDRTAERNRGKEQLSKRRHQDGDDERTRDRDVGKKHESRKWRDYDISERIEDKEPSQYRHEVSKSKRKRSRSREHEKDKSRRSISPSQRGRKQSTYDLREHGDFSSHSLKDRFGRLDSDIDKKRISGNGSGNKSGRHDTSETRLGGYSPRKRKSEAAVKTPSPTSRSPEKKNAGWDFPPVRKENKFPSAVQPDLPPLNKPELSNKHELSHVVPFASSIPKPTIGFLSSTPLKMNASVDSIQLTQATRPKRRLYVENLPSSASEAAVMEWLNNNLRPPGIRNIQGTSSCISCIVHKEKCQALVEFLTPEDASTALSFDGKTFFGNILKIRRPKDYVETGVSEKPVAAAVSVRNIVEDSPSKIFMGGISKVISSEMLMEIAGSFGPLKAYHFEANAELGGPCAFLEYVDQSVTLKACAGLNGMKLGGQVLTVMQAIPDASSVENLGKRPFYGIPTHAYPLLEEPTQVLMLNNVLDPDSLSSLPEPELEEILEDVRLECARFGMVKSINIARPTSSETGKVTKDISSAVDEGSDDISETSGSDREQIEENEEPADGNNSHYDDKQDISAAIGGTSKPEEANGINDDKHENKIIKDEICDTTMADNVADEKLEDNSKQISSRIDQLVLNDSKLTDLVQAGGAEMECKSLVKVNLKLEEGSSKAEIVSPELRNGVNPNSYDIMKGENEEEVSDPKDIFEPGCVLVEFKRAEASSVAAHCLHGRLFNGRIVSVEYVAHDIYHARFPK